MSSRLVSDGYNSTNDTAHKIFSQVENLIVDMELMLLEK